MKLGVFGVFGKKGLCPQATFLDGGSFSFTRKIKPISKPDIRKHLLIYEVTLRDSTKRKEDVLGVTKEEMIESQLKRRDIEDPRVISAMLEVDRTKFVPEELIDRAYEDGPLPIGKGQTISQPYIVAYMAQELKLNKEDTVLEVGTGCGYNAAVLSRIVSHVYSVEIVEWLVELARENLLRAGIKNISICHRDGYEGWNEKAPFDAIILTAAPFKIPEPLKKQLRVGGKLLAPVGQTSQRLIMLEKTDQENFREKELLPVKFVPMTGEAQKRD